MLFSSLLFASMVSSAAIITTPTVDESPNNIQYTISEPAITSQPEISFSGGQIMANGT